jgi:hypothetical protein
MENVDGSAGHYAFACRQDSVIIFSIQEGSAAPPRDIAEDETMRPEILDALRGTVERWREIAEGRQFDGGFDGCPLCSFIDPTRNGCGSCPVKHRTGLDGCHGTPYWDFEHFLITHRNDPQHFDAEGRPVSSHAKALAWIEYQFVEGLLPKPPKPGTEHDSTAFDEGGDAYCRGIARSDCLYEPGTRGYGDWLQGWEDAERIDREIRSELH